MNIYKRVPTEFAPETGFDVEPVPAALRAEHEVRFEELKNELLIERLEEAGDAEVTTHLRRAALEAAALAWVTPYPLLVFPVLFEEKAKAASTRRKRQRQIRERSRALLAA
jgi:hypothetical protein